jgi:hypothetical protein
MMCPPIQSRYLKHAICGEKERRHPRDWPAKVVDESYFCATVAVSEVHTDMKEL